MPKNDELLTRAVSNVTPLELAKKKLKAGKPIRLYLGIDPTGAKLHLGHSVVLRKLKAFADAGHEVILVIGSFTAMIGDPSGRDQMREPLTQSQIKKNFATYKKQAAKVLNFKRVKIVKNHRWLQILKFIDIIRLASLFTVQQFLERDMYQKRLKEGKPISLHEFLYPLMVGYDSVKLNVDAEIGGNDQYFNMLAGRTMQTALGKKDKFVLTTKLIEGTDGRKMSKTYDNCIWLEDDAKDMFGKTMRVNDDLMETYFECCTDVPMTEVKKILKGSPREAKVRLAKEIVSLYHGAKAAEKAAQEFDAVFKDKALPDDMPEIKVKKGSLLLDVLVEQKLIASKSEGRRLLQQKGIQLNDAPVKDVEAKAEQGIVRVGKRKFLRLV